MQQQQLEPIWDAIDNHDYAYALQLIEKTQKRYRVSDPTLLGLQGLCLTQVDRVDEALDICGRLKQAAPTRSQTYQTIHDILKASTDERATKFLMETMESGFRAIKSEVMGRMWFMEAVRTGDFVAQRKAAVELQKGFLSRDYFYLVLMSMRILYERRSTEKEKPLLGMLMYRMIIKAAEHDSASTAGPTIATKEELYLYLDILQLLGRLEEILTVLAGPHGRKHAGDHDILLLELEMLNKSEKHSRVLEIAQSAVTAGTDDWLVYRCYIDAAMALGISEADIENVLSGPTHGKRSRNVALSFVYLKSKTATGLREALCDYMVLFSDKLATFEDLSPYLADLDSAQKHLFLGSISSIPGPTDVGKIVLNVNIVKFRLIVLADVAAPPPDLLRSCLQGYVSSLKFGTGLKEQDNQYGDDFLLLATQLTLRADSNSMQASLQAVTFLEYGLKHSKHNYQFRLLLIKLYRELGAWGAAQAHFHALSIKQIQRDTMSYVLLEDSVSEYLSTTQMTAVKESQKIYYANVGETPESICQAYEHKSYSKVSEFLEFKDRLDGSLWWLQSQIYLTTLQLLLDKFDYPGKATITIPDKIYDNKTRDVMFDIYRAPGSLDKARTDHSASTKDIAAARRQADTVRMVIAVVKSTKSLDAAAMDTSGDLPVHDPVHDLVKALYDQKFNAQDSEALDSVISRIPAVSTTAATLDRSTILELGRIVQSIKFFAIMAPHIKSGIKLAKKEMSRLCETMKVRLQNIRQECVSLDLKVHVPAEMEIDPSIISAVCENVCHGRRECITYLLSVLKSAKL